MKNAEGDVVDLFVPRKCAATHRLIGPKDHASVQIPIAHVDKNGKVDGQITTFVLAGKVRRSANSDAALNRLAAEAGLLERF